MAFFSTVGIERSCSGVTIEHAVGAAISSLKRADLGRQVGFVVLVVHRQVVDAHEFGVELAGAELDQRLGDLRLIDSRRLEPTMTAICGMGHG